MNKEINQIENELLKFLQDMGIDEPINSSSTLKSLEMDSTEQADFIVFVKNKFGISLEGCKIEEKELKEISKIIFKGI